jgi:hypothetical protein
MHEGSGLVTGQLPSNSTATAAGFLSVYTIGAG